MGEVGDGAKPKVRSPPLRDSISPETPREEARYAAGDPEQATPGLTECSSSGTWPGMPGIHMGSRASEECPLEPRVLWRAPSDFASWGGAERRRWSESRLMGTREPQPLPGGWLPRGVLGAYVILRRGIPVVEGSVESSGP